MSKNALIVLGILVLVMGLAALFFTYFDVKDPVWHAVLKIIVGIAAIGIGVSDKK